MRTRQDEQRVILFVHAADEWYGSDYVLLQAVRALQGTEFTPIVILPDDVASELPPALRLSGRLGEMGVQVHHLPVAVLRRRYMTPVGLIKLALRAHGSRRQVLDRVGGSHVALVHSHTAGVLTGAHVARTLGVPHLWHVSEIVVRPRMVRQMLARTISRRADRIITVSEAVRDHLLQTCPQAAYKTGVIYNGIDTRRFDRVDPAVVRAIRDRLSPNGGPLVGMVGRVGMQKGQELLLQAMQEVLREVPDARLALVGGVLDRNFAAMDRLRTVARELGIADRVAIDGYCDDVPSVFAAMDIVIQPSLRPDSLPTTVLEAMASSKPVVAAANGGAPEMVVHGDTGLLIPTGDEAALAAAILGLLRDPALRQRMGRNGRERAERLFSPASFSAAYLREYRALCAGPQQRSR